MLQDSFFLGNKPWDHQRTAIERAWPLDEFGFLFDPGTGKTYTTINTLRLKYAKHGRLLKTLIIGPPIVLENWAKEIQEFSKIKKEDIVVLYGSGKERIKMMDKIGDKAKIIITNYETLNMGTTRDHKKKVSLPGELFIKLEQWGPEIMVLDESHRCKTHNAARTKRAIRLAKFTNYRYILTGSLVLNDLMDVFTQFLFLDKGHTFGQNFFVFRGRYFVDKNAGMPKDRYFPNWQPKEGAYEEINRLIRRKAMYVNKAECLDLPPMVRKTIPVGMSKPQEKAYNEMKQQLVAYIDGKAAVAELALTKALRLQQIVSGFVNVEEGGGKRAAEKFKKHPRREALKELLADIAPYHKVLVWAVFKENYSDIREVCEELKLDYVEVHGEVTAKSKNDAVHRLNNDPDCRVLIGHPGSGGIGINLVAASHAIFYSRSFSLEYEIQAEARNYRGGSEIHEKVTRIDLVTRNTIDEQVMLALASKKNIGYQVLKEMVEEGDDDH